MRKPKTIRKIIAEIERIWINNPEQRLGQMLVNAAQSAGLDTDIFYIEDDDMLKHLRNSKANVKENNGSSEMAE